MSNSSLVDYIKISPNSSNPRNQRISVITIHHMAGNLSVEACGNVFATTDRQASSNYGIGSDGRVGMYVEEANRSWCSSSRENDNKAITIEVANDDTTSGSWHVSDTALAKLIDLCTDICQRNGIPKLNFTGDKTGNLTMHKWFASTLCPGPYLESKFSYIADAVNKRLGGSDSTVTPATETSCNPEKTIWDFLYGKIGNAYGAAGLMGNLYAESGLKPTNLQNTYEKSLGMTDDQYTAAVDNGTYTNFVRDSAGYGLAQWTYWSRKQNLLNYAKSAGKSIGDLQMQLDFLWQELQSYSTVLNTLKTAASVKTASDAVLTKYECPADQSDAVKSSRAGFGQTYFDRYARTSTIQKENVTTATVTSNAPYLVRVSIPNLNIRKGPGTDFAKTGRYTGKGVFTIVEESDGQGDSKWGKLKSGAGWISLDYTNRV